MNRRRPLLPMLLILIAVLALALTVGPTLWDTLLRMHGIHVHHGR